MVELGPLVPSVVTKVFLSIMRLILISICSYLLTLTTVVLMSSAIFLYTIDDYLRSSYFLHKKMYLSSGLLFQNCRTNFLLFDRKHEHFPGNLEFLGCSVLLESPMKSIFAYLGLVLEKSMITTSRHVYSFLKMCTPSSSNW